MANVRFLAGYRREALLDPARVALVAGAVQDGDTIGDVEARLVPLHPSDSRPAILHLLWRGVLRADLSAPLEQDTPVLRAA